MKRYELGSDYGYCGMDESPDGDYVRWEDVQALLANQAAALRADILSKVEVLDAKGVDYLWLSRDYYKDQAAAPQPSHEPKESR